MKIQSKYVVLSNTHSLRLMFSFSRFSPPMKYCRETPECLDIVAEPANKAIALVDQKNYVYIHSKTFASGRASLNVLEGEDPITSHVGLAMKRFSPYYETVNRKITQLSEAGFFNKWEHEAFSNGLLKNHIEDIPAQVSRVFLKKVE